MSRTNNHRNKVKQTLEHERYVYRKFFLNTLNHCLTEHTPHSPNASIPVPRNDSLFSIILPLVDATVVRVAVGSNNLKRINGIVQYHRESLIEVNIPTTYALIFNYHSTIHGGGSSNTPNTRLFAVMGDKSIKHTLQTENKTRGLIPCGEDCMPCSTLKVIKTSNSGSLIPFQEGSNKEKKVGETLNDFNIDEHGFCIMKVCNETNHTSTVINQVKIFDEKRGVKFYSLGQEISKDGGGKRQMLMTTTDINTDFLLRKKTVGALASFIDLVLKNVSDTFSQKFGREFEIKGRTLLQNDGILGNQMLHTDG